MCYIIIRLNELKTQTMDSAPPDSHCCAYVCTFCVIFYGQRLCYAWSHSCACNCSTFCSALLRLAPQCLTLVIRACSAREATCQSKQWVKSASQSYTLGEGGEESLDVVRSLIPTLSNPLSIHFKLLKM